LTMTQTSSSKATRTNNPPAATANSSTFNSRSNSSPKVSSLTLNVKNVKDIMQFYLKGTNANEFFLRIQNEILHNFKDEEGFEFDVQRHFQHLYHSDKGGFLLKKNPNFIEMRNLENTVHAERIRDFLSEKGVTLPGAEGKVFLEPKKSKGFYYASFIVPYRVVTDPETNKSCIRFLVSMQWKKTQYIYWFIGGKRDHGDSGSLDTALREFNEETSHALPEQVINQLQHNCKQTKHFLNIGGTHYYFVPDRVQSTDEDSTILSDDLLNSVAEQARSKPSKKTLIAQWKEEFGDNKEAYAKAIEERRISFSFDISQRYRFVSLESVKSTPKNSIQEDTKTHGKIPANCGFHKPVASVLKKVMTREDNLIDLWNQASGTPSLDEVQQQLERMSMG